MTIHSAQSTNICLFFFFFFFSFFFSFFQIPLCDTRPQKSLEQTCMYVCLYVRVYVCMYIVVCRDRDSFVDVPFVRSSTDKLFSWNLSEWKRGIVVRSELLAVAWRVRLLRLYVHLSLLEELHVYWYSMLIGEGKNNGK